MLDLVSVHLVSHLIRGLRAAGRNRDLVDAVTRRLSDGLLLQDETLQTSLDEMRAGKGRVLRPKPR